MHSQQVKRPLSDLQKEPGRRLREIRDRNGASRLDIEVATGVKESQLVAWEHCRSPIDPRRPGHRDQVIRLARYLEVEEREIWGPDAWRAIAAPEPELGPPKYPIAYASRSMPYAGVVPAGDWGDPLMSDDLLEVGLDVWKANRFLTTVAGDSCWPALQQGDEAMFETDAAPADGVIVLAQRRPDHAVTVKLLRLDERGRPRLVPVNPEYSEPQNGDGWHVIARLVCVKRESQDGAQRRIYHPRGIRPEHLT